MCTDDPLWYKDAVIYALHVKTFCDGNADGVGDFQGLTSKLDYLQSLGVNCLWLLPFYVSPLRDDGYDIADYEQVDPRFGTLGDFKTFLDAAHARRLRVITELVINHTSDAHPWFQAARRAPAGSPQRDFYVWSDTDQRYRDARVIFSDAESSNWTWDPLAGQFYWHRFFHHQPDLNFDNPGVRQSVLDVLHFWFDLGVDGLRLDAIPHLFEREGTDCENLPETHAFVRELRAVVDRDFPGRLLLAEANNSPAAALAYFGDGDECQMIFHFPLVSALFLALMRQAALPVMDVVRRTATIPDACQWAIYLRNHDELSFSAVDEDTRARLLEAYAPAAEMRLNGGARRRLASLLDNDRGRIELAYALLLTLPGSPVLYYGDEIGMPDDVTLPDRDGLRLPMQWDIVSRMEGEPDSLLECIRSLIRLRQQHPALQRGVTKFADSGNPHVLAFLRQQNDEALLIVANLASTPQSVSLNVPSANPSGQVTLSPHAFHCFPVGAK